MGFSAYLRRGHIMTAANKQMNLTVWAMPELIITSARCTVATGTPRAFEMLVACASGMMERDASIFPAKSCASARNSRRSCFGISRLMLLLRVQSHWPFCISTMASWLCVAAILVDMKPNTLSME